jgi:hypothetical protein
MAKRRTGGEESTRWCPGCGRLLPLSAYWRCRAKKNGLQTECKACMYRRETLAKGIGARREQARLLREQLEREAWLGRHLLSLIENFCVCSFRNTDDVLRADMMDVRGHTRTCEEQSLHDLLIAVLDKEPQKQCRGPCGRTLAISAFGHDKNKPDGRLLRCKRCEAERVRAYKGKKRP